MSGHRETDPFPSEAELVLRHAVSRPVVREAIKMLTAKGLLVARTRTGTKVNPISSWSLLDADVLNWLQDGHPSLELLLQLLEVLIATEPLAAALAAQAADEADLKIIAGKFDRLVEASTNNDRLRADVEFHVAILNASKNPFFVQLQGAVDAALTLSVPYMLVSSDVPPCVTAHHAVLRALQRRKAQAAGTAMIDLLAEILTLIARSGSSLQPKRLRCRLCA